MDRIFTHIGKARERGAVMFLVAGTVVVVLLMGALAVDLSAVANRGQELQNAADAAALAGVQAYRAADGDEAAAWDAINDILRQNGIEDVNVDVTFPGENQTQVEVTVTDEGVDTYIAGVTGAVSDVERAATAEFVSCAASCVVTVEIPAPFNSVEAEGTGDGYKPIPVGDRLYAINHNSQAGGIVCIDRSTEDHCWDSPSRSAYASSGQTNPEMPHTAVYGTRIYWTASNSNGTYLFCFETLTDTPCSSARPINNSSRAWDLTRKDENRGGGTVLVDGLIYVFTDDHRVHCFDPTFNPIAPCIGQNGGLPSSLSIAEFAPGDPSTGNHGSSIDRIVDEDTGRIYSTLHVPSIAGYNGPVACNNDAPNTEFPEGVVVLKNAWTGLYLGINADRDGFITATDPTEDVAQWTVIQQSNGRVAFQSVTSGSTRVIDSDGLDFGHGDDEPEFGRYLDLSSGISSDDRWHIDYQGSTSRIRNSVEYGGESVYIKDDDGFRTGTYENEIADWIIRPWQCEDPAYESPTSDVVIAKPGTWLQCWDTANAQPCNNFKPLAIHSNADRFSGRLFFYYDGAFEQEVIGVCSTGFDGALGPDNFEVRCVDHVSGQPSDLMSASLDAFEATIASYTDSSPAAWGDPHYNENTNRVFYPTAHDHSRVVCWDFDNSSPCGVVQGYSPLYGGVEDYGFFSEGDCVYGLGHNSIFWAFKASDINTECTGSTTRTTIEPCDCSGEWRWGKLEFDVDLDLFDEFYIQVVNSAGQIVYPQPDPSNPHDPGHSLHERGRVIDLNRLPVSGDADSDFLEILVTVDTEHDPWAYGEQTFDISFQQTPKLTD